MGVNPAVKKRHAVPPPAEARELARLFAEVAIGLKRSDREAPPELRKAAEGAGLGTRHAAPIFTLAFEDQALSVS